MKSVEEIIETNDWSDLNPDERALIADLASNEEEFYQAKSFFQSLEPLVESTSTEVSTSIKTSLDKVFQAKHPGITQAWEAEVVSDEVKIIPIYQRNWFRIAAVLLIGGSVSMLFWKTNVNQAETKQEIAMTSSQLETNQTNTIHLKSKIENNSQNMANTKLEKLDNSSNDAKAQTRNPVTSSAMIDQVSLTEKNLPNSDFEVYASTPSMAESVSRGMDKDLNPYASDGITDEKRARPRPTANYFDLMEPSF